MDQIGTRPGFADLAYPLRLWRAWHSSCISSGHEPQRKAAQARTPQGAGPSGVRGSPAVGGRHPSPHIETGVGSCLASATQPTQPTQPKGPIMNTVATVSCTYAKLHNGSWGIRAKGIVTAGETVTVTKRDGTTKTETVGRVLSCKDGLSICAIEQATSGSRGGRRGSRSARRECDECGEYATPGTVCWETGCTH